jgi:hypothetical protein
LQRVPSRDVETAELKAAAGSVPAPFLVFTTLYVLQQALKVLVDDSILH